MDDLSGSGGRMPAVIASTGVVLLVGAACISLIRAARSQITPGFIVVLATSLPVSLLIVVGSYHLLRSGVSPRYYDRVATWTLSGGVVSGVLVGTIAPFLFDRLIGQLSVVHWGVSIGAGAGFFAGYMNSRLLQQKVTAERASVRAEETEQRQELLEYLNAVLRHEVLNTANVVLAQATTIEDRAEDETVRRDTGLIREEVNTMADIVRDIKLLVDAHDGTESLEPIDATQVLREEISRISAREEPVQIESTLQPSAVVMADSLLRRLFGSLLENAVEHNRSPVRIRVTADVSSYALTVRITDNGPGVPSELRSNLFDHEVGKRDDKSRLGTVIAGRLADRYDGDIALTETGSGGTTVTLVLPLADAAAAAAVVEDDFGAESPVRDQRTA